MISWNVNGLRAAVTKGFLDIFHDLDADIFCVQETKLQEGQIELDLPGYYDFWNYADKKGYSGVAMWTKDKIKQARIHSDILGSDHCPVELEINI